MAHQNQSNSSRKQKRNRGRGKIGNKLANRLDQWKKDAETRQQAHSQNRNYQQTQVGSFDRDHLEKKFTANEYVPQLNEVSKVTSDQKKKATTYKEFQKQQNKVNKMNNLTKYEQDAIEYKQQKKEEEFLKMKKEEQIESLLTVEIKNIIGKSEWDKTKIQQWMDLIFINITQLLEKYLKNAVYKYCIDVNIVKSTAIARQTEMLKTENDYSWNLKIKNGCGVIVIINCHAFKVG
eukprot:219938_1